MTRSPVILAIDPASRVTGLALLDAHGEIVNAFRATPDKGMGDKPAHLRVPAMAAAACETLYEFPTLRRVVVEVPSGRPGTGSKAGASSSLIVYGFAAGWIAAKVEAVCRTLDIECDLVTEAEWTQRFAKRCGGAAKAKRIEYAAARYPTYRAVMEAGKDPGGDVADALCLGLDSLARYPITPTIPLQEAAPCA